MLTRWLFQVRDHLAQQVGGETVTEESSPAEIIRLPTRTTVELPSSYASSPSPLTFVPVEYTEKCAADPTWKATVPSAPSSAIVNSQLDVGSTPVSVCFFAVSVYVVVAVWAPSSPCARGDSVCICLGE